MLLKKHIHKLSLLTTFMIMGTQPLMATTLPGLSIPTAITEISEKETEVSIDYTQYITEDKLLLPRNLYVLKGSATSGERLNIFYRNALLTLSDHFMMSGYSSYGQCLTGRWLYKTLSDDSLLPNEPFTIDFTTRTDRGRTTQSMTVELVDNSNTTPVRLLPIGDSLTRAGVYLSQVVNSIPNVTTLGTRYYPTDGIPVREGRGGWTLEKYFTYIDSAQLDSPFVFPTDVSGAHYKGNTRDWKAICYTAPNDPAYNGFQKIARGWMDEGEFLYDENGYYKYPIIGDVMVDPTLPEGSQWIEWNGFDWQTMMIQPTQFEFNFTKYMDRYKAAFTNGTPTHVSILLGANEFGYNKEIAEIDLFINRLNEMINSIQTYDPSIKIIHCTPTIAPNASLVTASTKTFYKEYDLRVKYVASKLLEAFDTDEALARQIYIAPMTLTLDATHGYNYIEKNEIINGFTNFVTDAANSIHPSNECGQLQMGSTLAAVIQKFR